MLSVASFFSTQNYGYVAVRSGYLNNELSLVVYPTDCVIVFGDASSMSLFIYFPVGRPVFLPDSRKSRFAAGSLDRFCYVINNGSRLQLLEKLPKPIYLTVN